MKRSVRIEVLERDRYRCRGCMINTGELHHIQFRSQGGPDEASNLITLCPSCHRRAHGTKGRQVKPEFLKAMEEFNGQKHLSGCEMPHWYREKVYRFIIDELERLSPETPYALCRSPRVMWDALEEDFARHGQTPDYYVCNCGPYSAPGHRLLRTATV